MLCIYSVYVYMYECFLILHYYYDSNYKNQTFRDMLFHHQFFSTSLSDMLVHYYSSDTGFLWCHESNRDKAVESHFFFSIGAKLTDLLYWNAFYEYDVYNGWILTYFLCWTSNKKLSISSHHAHFTFLRYKYDLPTFLHHIHQNLIKLILDMYNTYNILYDRKYLLTAPFP